MDDPGIWKEAAKYLWGVLVPVGVWAWKKQDERLGKLEDKYVSKDAIKERKEEVDKSLENRRQDVIALHDKIDEHVRADQLLHNAMIDKLGQIGADVAFIKGQMQR